MLTLLKPAKRKPRPTEIITVADLRQFSPERQNAVVWGCDIETNGLDAADPACTIVGIGLASEFECFYIDVQNLDADDRSYLIEWLKSVQLVAFNTLFDGTFLQAWTGEWLNWVGCSYGLYKAAAGEGFQGQSWGLKQATLTVLGWPERHDKALRRWLVENGYTKGNRNAEGD